MSASLAALGVTSGSDVDSVGGDAPSPDHLGSMSAPLSVASGPRAPALRCRLRWWWLLQTMIPYSGLKRYWRFPGSFARVGPWRIRQDKPWRFARLPCACPIRRPFSLLDPPVRSRGISRRRTMSCSERERFLDSLQALRALRFARNDTICHVMHSRASSIGESDRWRVLQFEG
jgi:hypothetical protein